MIDWGAALNQFTVYGEFSIECPLDGCMWFYEWVTGPVPLQDLALQAVGHLALDHRLDRPDSDKEKM